MKPNQLKALNDRRAALLAESRAILEQDTPTAEQTARSEAIIASEVPAIDAALAAYARQQELERSAPAVGLGITVTPRSEADPMRGFANVAEFARSVHAAAVSGAPVDERLRALYHPGTPGAAPSNYHLEGHSAEGYEVPVQARQEIWQLVFGTDDLLSMIQTEPTAGNAVDLTADETTPWAASGVRAYWRSEAQQMTATKLNTEPRIVRLHELYAFVTATDEVLADAPRLQSRIMQKAPLAISWKASEAIFAGTGAGQPLGMTTAPAFVAVAKESGQAAATLLPKNILNVYSRRLAMPGARWVWLANSDIVPQLVDLKIGNEPSWTAQSQGLQDAPAGRLLGLPIIFNEHSKTLGTVGDLCLVDLNGYYAAIKSGGIKFDSSIHLFFDYNVTAFRWVFRLGGQPFLSAPVSPAQGSNTKSHFLGIATRA